MNDKKRVAELAKRLTQGRDNVFFFLSFEHHDVEWQWRIEKTKGNIRLTLENPSRDWGDEEEQTGYKPLVPLHLRKRSSKHQSVRRQFRYRLTDFSPWKHEHERKRITAVPSTPENPPLLALQRERPRHRLSKQRPMQQRL